MIDNYSRESVISFSQRYIDIRGILLEFSQIFDKNREHTFPFQTILMAKKWFPVRKKCRKCSWFFMKKFTGFWEFPRFYVFQMMKIQGASVYLAKFRSSLSNLKTKNQLDNFSLVSVKPFSKMWIERFLSIFLMQTIVLLNISFEVEWYKGGQKSIIFAFLVLIHSKKVIWNH